MKSIIYLSIFIVAFAMFLFGFDAALFENITANIADSFEIPTEKIVWLNKISFFVGSIALIFAGFMCNSRGRKKTLQLAICIFLVATLLLAFTGNFTIFQIAKVLSSIAFSFILVAVPVYLAEVAPKQIRGFAVVAGVLALLLGKWFGSFYYDYIMSALNEELGYLESYGFLSGFIDSENRWGFMLLINGLFGLAVLALLTLVPKSARWLASQRDVTAKLYLDKFYDSDESQNIYDNIKKSYNNLNPQFDDWGKPIESDIPKAKLGDIFSGAVFPMFFMSLVLAIAYKLCGSEAILNLKDSILSNANLDETSFFTGKNWFLIASLVITGVVMFFVDSFGRKKIIMIGIAGITLSSLLLAYGYDNLSYTFSKDNIQEVIDVTRNPGVNTLVGDTFYNQIDLEMKLEKILRSKKDRTEHITSIKTITSTLDSNVMFYGLIGLMLFTVLALVTLFNLIVTEIFPNWLRSVAVGFMLFLVAVFGYLANNSFDTLITKYGGTKTFFAFALLGLLSFILTGFKLIETKQMALEEIPNWFSGKRKSRPTTSSSQKRRRKAKPNTNLERNENKSNQRDYNKKIQERDHNNNPIAVEKAPETNTYNKPVEENTPEIKPKKSKKKSNFKGLDLDLD